MRGAGLALEDLNGLLRRLGRLYGIEAPELRQTAADACCLLVDVDVLHPLRLPPRNDTAVVWSRPAAMAVADLARRIEVRADSPRFLPGSPDAAILDSFVLDPFRKNGFRRDGVGGSDPARIIPHILPAQNVVELFPPGA